MSERTLAPGSIQTRLILIGAAMLLALAMLPAAYWSGGADKLPGQARAKASPRADRASLQRGNRE